MKKIILYSSTILLIAIIILAGCEFGTETEDVDDDPGGLVSITGKVVEEFSGNPIDNVAIRIVGGLNEEGTSTDANGEYSEDIDLEQDSELLIIATRTGYKSDTLQVFAKTNGSVTVPIIKLVKLSGSGDTPSGSAASIFLYSQSVENIGVIESGSPQTAQVIYEVQDSSGIPIDENHSVVVNFNFGDSPGGGEYIYPTSVETNALGRATASINSGNKAGVVQVVAEISYNGKTIRSKPIFIAIHGGLPDINHFGIASQKLNYPAYGVIGYQIPFTAYVGDKYSNPVRTGTAVYFETTSGIIEGSNLTDGLGQSTVVLLTQPFPSLPDLGPGFFTVTAKTSDENQQSISTNSLRLLSGKPVIAVNPHTIDISNGGEQIFNYAVSDGNGNPLVEGTTISVKVDEGDIKVSGDTDIILPDTQSKNFTSFSFLAYDSKPDTTVTKKATITISTSGPNGDKKISITGNSR